MLIPGDLPVFFRIALECCSRQESANLDEVIVVPDKAPKGFDVTFRNIAKRVEQEPDAFGAAWSV